MARVPWHSGFQAGLRSRAESAKAKAGEAKAGGTPKPEQAAEANQIRERIKEIIETESVVVFMKGTPERVACGNSARVLEALKAIGASVTAVDVLPDPRIRQELTALSDWPTIPQVFVQGELIGGADIVEEMLSSGELERTLAPVLAGD